MEEGMGTSCHRKRPFEDRRDVEIDEIHSKVTPAQRSAKTPRPTMHAPLDAQLASDSTLARARSPGQPHMDIPRCFSWQVHTHDTANIKDRLKERSNSAPEGPRRTATSNWKVVRQAVHRVALPRFTLGSGFLHAMIAYRVTTEGESGNNLSFELYKKIRELSLADLQLQIPQYAWGTWPIFARTPDGFQPSQAKVYLDRECLQDGEDWEIGFVQGLSSSIVMICLLSFNEHGRGSLGDLTTLLPSEGQDRVDNVLLELIVGKELRELGEHSALSAILPILVGPQRKDGSFEPFPFSKLGLLSPEPSVMTNDRAASILAMLGVGDKQIQAMRTRSVRQHIDGILKNQGIHASSYANQDQLVLEGARRALGVIKKEVFNIRTNPKRFANNSPMGQEVLDWLREKLLGCYVPIFLHHGLNTLLSVKELSREQVSRLTTEFRDIYTLADQKESVAWSTFGPSAVFEKVGTVASELQLWQTIRTLDRDPRARKMTERLEWFEDCYYAVKKKQRGVAHAVMSRNFVERYIELQTMHVILSVLVLYNLVEMQRNFATWYDYCQEHFVLKIEIFLAVVWHANLRRLGYNGPTISRDLVNIFFVILLRKSFVLCLVFGQPGRDAEAIEIAFRILENFAAAICVKYRQEYFALGRLSFIIVDLILNDNHHTIIILLGFIMCFWYLLHGLIFLKKDTVEATRFRKAWVECSERNPDVVTELTKLSTTITVRLDQQREQALQVLPWYRKVQAYLEQRVGRWSLLCKGKVRQNSTDLDQLMEIAGVINEKFLDLVSEICFKDCYQNHNSGLEFVAGPVKQPMRTLQKLVRRYRRDVGCLTDLVRCTVIANSLENVKDFLQLLCSRSVAGLDTSDEGNGLRQRLGEQLDTGDEIFRITALENRFDPSHDDELSWGYRDLAMNVEVGWIVSSGMVSFQKVCDWRRLNCITHICEIQVRTRAMHELAVQGHTEYCALRNSLSM